MDPMNGKPAFGIDADTDYVSGATIEMPDDTSCFKTDFIGGYGVESVFDNSRYFDAVESTAAETKYEAPGMEARVDRKEGVVEYAVAVDGEVHSGTMQEFVEGIVRAVEDVTPEFREEIGEDVYRVPMTDGGSTLEDVDHESPYSNDLQGTFERSGADTVVADGGRETGFPAYDGSGAVETDSGDSSEFSMGDLTE